MGRYLVGSCGLLVAIGLTCQPAHAGDRKSASRGEERAERTVVASKGIAMSLRSEILGAPTGRIFAGGRSFTANRTAGGVRWTPNAAATRNEHRPLTLFHLDSKFGNIAVQPVVGHVNGAQFSLGF